MSSPDHPRRRRRAVPERHRRLARRPIIGWITETDAADWRQARAELELDRDGDVESHTIEGGTSTQVAWPFAPLAPREDVPLRVRVTGEDGGEGAWSEPRRIFAGFLGDGEWTADDDRPRGPAEHGAARLPAHRVRRRRRRCARATLYATAVGVYQAAINGDDVDDQVMKPGWTPYQYAHDPRDDRRHRPRRARDATRSACGSPARGRPSGSASARTPARIYGDQPRFAAQLLIEYADGRSEWVTTDAAWRGVDRTASPRAASTTASTTTPARRSSTPTGVASPTPGFDDSAWAPAAERDADRRARGARLAVRAAPRGAAGASR